MTVNSQGMPALQGGGVPAGGGALAGSAGPSAGPVILPVTPETMRRARRKKLATILLVIPLFFPIIGTVCLMLAISSKPPGFELFLIILSIFILPIAGLCMAIIATIAASPEKMTGLLALAVAEILVSSAVITLGLLSVNAILTG